MYSQDLIDAVLRSSDIVSVVSSYINVEKHGRAYTAVCPFHDDTNPSLNISQEKQIFKCFSCGVGGNAITFVQRFEKIPYSAAVRKTAEISNFSDPRLIDDAPKVKIDEDKQKLYNCINDLNDFYLYGLTVPEGATARDYLASRHIDETQQKKYQIGYSLLNGEVTVKYLQSRGHSLKSIENIGIAIAKSEGTSDTNAGRITFPICDPNGQVVAFSCRRLDGVHDRKYVNSPEGPIFHKGSVLYNYHNVAISAKREGYCYVLEGFMDVMALERAGIPNAVALMGTGLTDDHVELLRRLRCEIRLSLDGDSAGQDGMMRAIPKLGKANIPLRFVDYGADLRDPDEILQQDGPEALRARMNTLIDPIDFQLGYHTKTKKPETSEERQKIVYSFLPYLRSLPPGIELEDYIIKLSNATGYAPGAIRQLLLNSKEERNEAEGTYYREAKILHTSLQQRRIVKRLINAEKTILHYMLLEPEAIEFFRSSVKDFSTDAYEEVAMCILEYAKEHPGEIRVDSILARMEQEEGEHSEEAIKAASELAFDETYAPYTADILSSCLATINQEKERIHDHDSTAAEIASSKSESDAAKAIAEFAKRKGEKWAKKTKKGGS